jgi:hypothetical protein
MDGVDRGEAVVDRTTNAGAADRADRRGQKCVQPLAGAGLVHDKRETLELAFGR